MLDLEELVSAFQRYGEAIALQAGKRKDKADLPQLDEWYRNCKAGGELTKDELIQVVKWKLCYGSRRPALLKQAESNSDEDVKRASAAAFALADKGDVKGAVEELSVLRGIGVATASALLATHNRSIPFMCDQAMQGLLGKTDYKWPLYKQFFDRMTEEAPRLAAALEAAGVAAAAQRNPVEALEMAFFASSILATLPQQNAAAGQKKAAAGQKQSRTKAAEQSGGSGSKRAQSKQGGGTSSNKRQKAT